MSFRCQDCMVAFPNAELPGECVPHRVVTKTQKNEGAPGFQIKEERNLCRICAVKRGGAGSPKSGYSFFKQEPS